MKPNEEHGETSESDYANMIFTIILGIIFGLGMFLNSISIVAIIKTLL